MARELEKTTTILFPPKLHAQLTRLARKKGVSLGHLVRLACEERYGKSVIEERLRAVAALRQLSLPVDTPKALKRPSVPATRDLTVRFTELRRLRPEAVLGAP